MVGFMAFVDAGATGNLMTGVADARKRACPDGVSCVGSNGGMDAMDLLLYDVHLNKIVP